MMYANGSCLTPKTIASPSTYCGLAKESAEVGEHHLCTVDLLLPSIGDMSVEDSYKLAKHE